MSDTPTRVHEAVGKNAIAFLMTEQKEAQDQTVVRLPVQEGDEEHGIGSLVLERLSAHIAALGITLQEAHRNWQKAELGSEERLAARIHFDELRRTVSFFKAWFYHQASADAQKPLPPIACLRVRGEDIIIVIPRRNQRIYNRIVEHGEEGASLNGLECPWDEPS
jgi:hypothetical protein